MRVTGWILALGGLVLTGCPGFGDETLAGRAGLDGVPTYEADVRPILEQYCLTCHGETLRAGAPVHLHTYADASRLAARIQVRAVQQVSMPPGGGLSDERARAILDAWVNGGAPRGEVTDPEPDMGPEPDAAPDPDGGPAPDGGGPAGPTWNADTSPIFAANCAFPGCHGGANPTGNLNLETYAGFRAGGFSGDLRGGGDPAQSFLIDRLRARRGNTVMPQGGPPLPDADIRTIEAWIAAGSPEGT